MLKKEDLYNTRIVTNGDEKINKEIVSIAKLVGFYLPERNLIESTCFIFTDEGYFFNVGVHYNPGFDSKHVYKTITIEELRAMINPEKINHVDNFREIFSKVMYNIQLPRTIGIHLTKEEVNEIKALIDKLKEEISNQLDDYFNNNIKSRQIVEQPKTYKRGQIFRDTKYKCDYILAASINSCMVAVSLTNGNIFAAPSHVDDFFKVTEKELSKIFHNELERFELVEKQ